MLPNEIKVCYNVLTGAVRILSVSGTFDYEGRWGRAATTEQRIKDLIVLLKVIRRIRHRQTLLDITRKKIIEAQIVCRHQKASSKTS